MRKMRQSAKYAAIAYSRFSDMPNHRRENRAEATVIDWWWCIFSWCHL